MGPDPPPTEMPLMIKIWQKSLLFLQFQFLLDFSRTTYTCSTVINNNIDNQGAKVPQFNFYKLIYMRYPGEIKIFVLKAAVSGPHLTFL